MKRGLATCLVLGVMALVGTATLMAQGVTTSSITAIVMDQSRNRLASANVTAVHLPSGTTYSGRTGENGRATLPGMRVGGPYRVTVAAIGFEPSVEEDVFLALGVATDLEFVMRAAAVTLGEIVVTAPGDHVFSSERTGAATFVNREVLMALPTISQRIETVARLSPQYSGGPFGMSFAGQDNRLNNITVDGSYFNNSFGLAGQPGDRTNVAPISIAAIEQIQISIAPYDVRQGNFVGAGINTVTRSGTNEFSGSLAYIYRDNGLVGTQAGTATVPVGDFQYNQIGGWLSGPVIRNKMFFFLNFEDEALTEPGTTFSANTGGQPIEGGTTRVLQSDLNQLSDYLQTNFDYNTDVFQGYDHKVPGTRFLAKVDYNLSDRSKISVRYNHLDSNTDVLVSNSSSLGFGTRRTNLDGLNFRNSNYIIKENIRSIVGEWNAGVGQNMANNLLVGYSHHDESRDSRGTFFPMVDILEAGRVYTTFGFEPFTPNNELRYNSFQLQNNFSIYGAKHDQTFGVSIERYESENVFFPGSQSVYVYNSLQDFFTDADDFLANPNRTTSPVTLRRFQVRWSNIPGQEKPIQPLEVLYAGAYAQDEWRPMPNLKLTLGLRVDVPWFGETGYQNVNADALTFRDEDGNNVQYETAKLPDANLLWSPRVGFYWDVSRERQTQLRGGTGIFTGRPAYVWISNQIGNTGVLTGFERLDNTTARPFHPDPNHYKPSNVTGAPASSYELALTDPGFQFPQIWRSNLAVDHRLPWGLTGTAEFIYNRDVNGIYYINANLPAANASFSGVDNRPRWTTGNRIHANVDNAVVLKNQSEGYSWVGALSVEKAFSEGLYAKAAYSYGESKNTIDPGSIAFGSWNNNQHPGDPNNPRVGFSSNSPGHRLFLAASYRRQLFSFGATSASIFWEARTQGSASFTFSGDLNGDGGTSNDLIYIPRDASEMNFQPYTVTVSGTPVTFTREQQEAAWEAYIQQDEYLRENRGQYAERGAVFMPMVRRADLSVAQELFANLLGARNSIQLRADILNVGNLINDDWGVGDRFVSTQPLIVPSSAQGGPADAQGRAQYRLRNIGNQLISETYQSTAGLGDVYRVQFSVRYVYNF